MSRYPRKKHATAEGIANHIRLGYGAGELADFKPWVSYTDFSSRGTSTCMPGAKTGRSHELFSRSGERSYFMICEWSPLVVDINEQFPLLPWEETVEIAEKHGLRHPVDVTTKHPWVLTSDFRLTLNAASGPRRIIRTIKPRSQLGDPNVWEKLEIERLYWTARALDWGIIVNEDIPEPLVKNIEWIHDLMVSPAVRTGPHPNEALSSEEIIRVEEFLRPRVQKNDTPLHEISDSADRHFGYADGTSINVVRLLLAKRTWEVDMNERLDPAVPLKVARLAVPLEDGV